MSLHEAIYKAMDYEKEIPAHIAYEEFNRKLGDTYCLLNNKVVFIKHTNADSLTCVDLDLQQDIVFPANTVHSLEILKPKPGLYLSNNNLYFLRKLPERQWKKSFCFENHSIESLDISSRETYNVKALLENKYSYYKETLIYKNLVFFYNIAVGILKPAEGVIVIFNENFNNEIRELWNEQYRTYLDTNVLEELPEKNL